MKQKVTIVIPVYNGADYLAQAIDSALTQTYGNTEILVVNDGSTDDGATERICQRYGSKIRYFSKANGGVASALNVAVQEMSGDYFSWLSHDDLYTPDKIAHQMDVLVGLPDTVRERTILYSDYAVFSTLPENGVPVSISGVDNCTFRFWLTCKNQLHGCTLLIPRDAFTQCGLFDESLSTTQDFDLWFRMAEIFQFQHVPEVLVKARSHAEQGSIVMAATAKAECNALLERFVRNLSRDELTNHGSRTQAAAYTELMASFWLRGFDVAAKKTFSLAWPEWRKEGPTVVVRHLATILRIGFVSQILRPIRAMISPRVRLKIRTFIGYFANSKSATEQLESRSLEKRFSAIYERNIFGGQYSRSGAGSDLVQTEIIRNEIPNILRDLNAKSFLDAPCGDWFWMQHVDLPVDSYIGVDIVSALIAQNQQRFGSPKHEFRCLNLAEDELPEVDVIFSRDCLVHLSLDNALAMLSNFKRSGSKYLLTTTFSEYVHNKELYGDDSFWRPLNMQLAPFNFPKPLLVLNEGCTEGKGRYSSKSLGLWRLSDIAD